MARAFFLPSPGEALRTAVRPALASRPSINISQSCYKHRFNIFPGKRALPPPVAPSPLGAEETLQQNRAVGPALELQTRVSQRRSPRALDGLPAWV